MPDIQTATHGPIDIDGLPLQSQRFLTGTPVTNEAVGAPGASTTVTLPGAVGLTTYLEGFVLAINPPSAAAGGTSLDITGLLGGTMHWPTPQQLTSAEIYIQHEFNQPRPASAANTAIVLNYPATASGGGVILMAWGYQA